jgi:hypothetical protein
VCVIGVPHRFFHTVGKTRKKKMQCKHRRDKTEQYLSHSLPELETTGEFETAASAQLLPDPSMDD